MSDVVPTRRDDGPQDSLASAGRKPPGARAELPQGRWLRWAGMATVFYLSVAALAWYVGGVLQSGREPVAAPAPAQRPLSADTPAGETPDLVLRASPMLSILPPAQ